MGCLYGGSIEADGLGAPFANEIERFGVGNTRSGVFVLYVIKPRDQINFVREEPKDLQFLPMIWAIYVVEDVSLRRTFWLGHVEQSGSVLQFYLSVKADTASAACPSQSGHLAITSTTFAAAIWDTDEPYSVKLRRLQSRLWQCHHGAQLCLCNSVNFGSTSAFLRWHMSIKVAKWTFFLSLCVSRITSFLLFTFSTCQAGIVSSFFPLFVHYFCIRNFHRLWLKNKLVFARNVVFMIFRMRRFNSLPCGFMGFQYHPTEKWLQM